MTDAVALFAFSYPIRYTEKFSTQNSSTGRGSCYVKLAQGNVQLFRAYLSVLSPVRAVTPIIARIARLYTH